MHKRPLALNLTFMDIMDYKSMQSLNTTRLTLEQLEQITCKSPNYTMVNYDSIGEYRRQIDENYANTMPIFLMIIITVLGLLMIGARIIAFCYCKHKNIPTCSKTLCIFWHKENPKETSAMLSFCPQQALGYPKITATLRQ